MYSFENFRDLDGNSDLRKSELSYEFPVAENRNVIDTVLVCMVTAFLTLCTFLHTLVEPVYDVLASS
jgi:hypothetical protein